MRYIKLSLKYMFKNFFELLLVVLLPAVIAGLVSESCSTVRFLAGFMDGSYDSFTSVYLSMGDYDWKNIVAGVLMLPVAVIMLSGACGMVSRHMRLGVLNFKNFNRRINNNFLVILKTTLLLIVLMQIYAIIISATTFLWVKLFATIEGAYAMTIISNVVMILSVTLFVSVFMLSVPTMSITGLNMRRAMAESMTMIKGNFFRIFFAVIFPLCTVYALMCVLAAFGFWWRWILYPIGFVLIFSYYISLMYSSYCDIADVDREDLKSKYLFN